MQVPRYRHALFVALLALVGSMLTMGPAFAASDCPADQTEFKINNRPANGTYGDGTLSVTISNSQEDSFSWSSNITVSSVMVKGGPGLRSNPGGRSGTASSPDNPNSGKRYGVSHVSFCYSVDDEEEETEEEDCVEKNGGKECDEDDCPENGNGKGSMNDDECDEDDEEECPDGSSMGSKGQCEEDDLTDCPADGGNGSMNDEDCEETLPDVDEKPANPDDGEGPDVIGGRVDSGPKPAPPGTRVRGLRFSDRGGDARPQVQNQQQPGALPFTGGAVLPYLLLGLGLVGSGALLWRRRHAR